MKVIPSTIIDGVITPSAPLITDSTRRIIFNGTDYIVCENEQEEISEIAKIPSLKALVDEQKAATAEAVEGGEVAGENEPINP